MNTDYSTWTKKALINEAFRLLDHAGELLLKARANHEAKVASLKSAIYDELSPEDQKLLDAQLAFEKEKGICYPTQASQATSNP